MAASSSARLVLGSFLPEGFNSLEEYGAALSSFLESHRHIFDLSFESHAAGGYKLEKAVHFLVWDHWTRRVPADWRVWFADIRAALDGEQDAKQKQDLWLQAMIDLQSARWQLFGKPTTDGASEVDVFHKALPPSFQEFVRRASALRPKVRNDRQEDPELKEGGRRKWFEQPRQSQEDSTVLMKQKKKYETRILGEAVGEQCDSQQCNAIVDVGAGKGYLTQYLQSRCPDARVIGVEGSASYSESFESRAEALKQRDEKEKARKLKAGSKQTAATTTSTTSQPGTAEPSTSGTPNAIVVCERVPLGVDASDFWRKTLCKGGVMQTPKVLLTGLHCCGDLTPTILKLFLNSPEATALTLVGCCYHMLTEPSPEVVIKEEEYGFPLSKFFKRGGPSEVRFMLSSGGHLASNALPEFTSVDDFRHSGAMQSFRAAIEGFINKRVNKQQLSADPQPHHIGNMRHRFGESSFGVYAARAVEQMLRKLPNYSQCSPEYKERLFTAFTKEELVVPGGSLQKEADEYYNSLKPLAGGIHFEVTCFAAIKNLLGPLLEALIIVDRLLFIQDHSANLDSFGLIRLFSPDISPRSYAITAVKKKPATQQQ